MKASVYTRPGKPIRIDVRRRPDFSTLGQIASPAIVAVDRATECHVTPPDVAALMVDYLNPLLAEKVLEPSAGTGNLSRALINAGYSPSNIVQVERHIRLSQGLDGFGQVINRCFLEYANEQGEDCGFHRIIMNPPFSDVRKHIAAARGLLKCGGELVAIVPCTFQSDASETLEFLSDSTFPTARVRTKIIRITN